MTHLQTSLLAVVLALTLLNVALTRQARAPISSCEARLAQFESVPWQGKGTIPIETNADAEAWVNFDARTQ